MDKILQNAKAVCSLATAVATALLAQYGPGGILGGICSVVVVVGGVFATWRIPNAAAPVVANKQTEF
jgi:hypothetical protein